MNRYAAGISALYALSLACLAIGILVNPGESIYAFPGTDLIFIGALAAAAVFLVFRAFPENSLPRRFFTAGCTLLILLLPFGDLFILIAVPLLIFYLTLQRRRFFALFRFQQPPAKLWLGFLGACLITAFFARSIGSALAMCAALFGYGLIFCLGVSYDAPQKETRFLSDLFTAVLPLTVCFMFFHLWIGRSIVLLGVSFNADKFSASFISNWAANAAGFLVIGFTLLFARFLRAVQEGRRAPIFWAGAALAVVFAGIWATQTRMVLFFFIGFGLCFLIGYPWTFFRRSRFLLVLLPLLLLPPLARYSDKWRETLSNPLQQHSLADRANQAAFGISLLKSGFLWQGAGLFNFRIYYNQGLEISGKDLPRVEFLHNIFLSSFVETGLIGGLLFCAAVLCLFLQYIKYRSRPLSYMGMLFLAGVLCHNITDNWLFVLKFSLLSFFLLGAFYPKKPERS